MSEPQPPEDVVPVAPVTPAAPCVYEVKQYRDHEGHNLTEQVLISGASLPPGLSRFMGQIFLTLQAGPQEQTVPVPPFVIEADTLERAFALFHGLAVAAGTVFKQNLIAQQAEQQRRIQRATPADAARLLGPDGQYLSGP